MEPTFVPTSETALFVSGKHIGFCDPTRGPGGILNPRPSDLVIRELTLESVSAPCAKMSHRDCADIVYNPCKLKQTPAELYTIIVKLRAELALAQRSPAASVIERVPSLPDDLDGVDCEVDCEVDADEPGLPVVHLAYDAYAWITQSNLEEHVRTKLLSSKAPFCVVVDNCGSGMVWPFLIIRDELKKHGYTPQIKFQNSYPYKHTNFRFSCPASQADTAIRDCVAEKMFDELTDLVELQLVPEPGVDAKAVQKQLVECYKAYHLSITIVSEKNTKLGIVSEPLKSLDGILHNLYRLSEITHMLLELPEVYAATPEHLWEMNKTIMPSRWKPCNIHYVVRRSDRPLRITAAKSSISIDWILSRIHEFGSLPNRVIVTLTDVANSELPEMIAQRKKYRFPTIVDLVPVEYCAGAIPDNVGARI